MSDLCDLVDPFMAVNSPGHCLPGPYHPFGLAKPGPDTVSPQNTNGYESGKPILRFSQNHVAGTGGGSRYGNVGITPFCGEPRRNPMAPLLALPIERLSDALPINETATLGRYGVTLMPWGIDCAVTATPRVALYRFSYPQGSVARLLVDGGAVIQGALGAPVSVRTAEYWDGEGGSIGGTIQIRTEQEVVGRCDLRGGWGHHEPYSVFFCLQTSSPISDAELCHNTGLVPGGIGRGVTGPCARAVLAFEGVSTLEVRVGISFVSIAKARKSIEREVGRQGFEAIVARCRDAWRPILSQYQVSGGSEEQRRLFATLLYRLYAGPTDLGVDDENPFWSDGRRQFTDYYCLWDSIRNANSFFHLFDPALSRDLMNSLLGIAEHSGWLPDAHTAGHHAYLQSACACDVLFSEAARKGIEGVDYGKALRYCEKNATEVSPDPMVMGRYVEDFQRHGYLSATTGKSCVSRHIEYTYYDWCMARLADHLGFEDRAAVSDQRAGKLWALWNSEEKVFWPRNGEGEWLAGDCIDPWRTVPESWNDPFSYEASLALWSMNGLHDIPGTIKRYGGDEAFLRRLDRLWEEGGWHVKETMMHVPHLYTCAGRPDLAAERVLASLEHSFALSRNGLRDNEDMGCQSAYYLWHSMGIYPLYGQALYFLTPPLFDRVEAACSSDRRLVITCERTGKGLYIQAARLNGEPLDRAWLLHAEICSGAELHFVLGDTTSNWGQTSRPPLPEL